MAASPKLMPANCSECGTQFQVVKSHAARVARQGRRLYCGRACFRSSRAVSDIKLYRVWHSMRQRCGNPKSPAYHCYGGRGIKVCDRWVKSFSDFCEDMGPKPSPKHTVERIDNDGDYEPDNCCWATRTEQGRNRAYVKLTAADAVEIKTLLASGSKQHVLASKFGVSRSTIAHIATERNWRDTEAQING